ncbi:MAG: pantothenate kinase, partial [Candidatus Thermoplasmatota archaeon]
MRAKAFSPSHVSGFFEIHLEGELLKSGSRGAGICLSEGVETIVELKKSNRQEIEIFLNEKKEEANTTKNVVKSLIGKKKYSVKVRSYFKLPVSQGFGISGAGALSTALAL